MAELLRRQTTWDLNLESGLGGVWATPPHHAIGFVRAGAGLTFVRDPLYDTLRVTYEYSGLSPATFGLQAEVAWFEKGFWAQGGLLYDVSGHGGLMAALGFAVLGAEVEYRTVQNVPKAWALYAKLRVPISAFVRAAMFR
jgi:hypothetical protein